MAGWPFEPNPLLPALPPEPELELVDVRPGLKLGIVGIDRSSMEQAFRYIEALRRHEHDVHLLVIDSVTPPEDPDEQQAQKREKLKRLILDAMGSAPLEIIQPTDVPRGVEVLRSGPAEQLAKLLAAHVKKTLKPGNKKRSRSRSRHYDDFRDRAQLAEWRRKSK